MRTEGRIGRPPTCVCGSCEKCRRAAYMREWWPRKTLEEKREHIAKRDPVLVREQDRRKQAKRRAHGSEPQLQKIWARRQVKAAIEQGRLERLVCESADCEEMGHAHHEDYSRPLDVRWLCRKHHNALHAPDYQRRAA